MPGEILLPFPALWLPAIISFASLREQPGATEGGGNAFDAALQNLALLKSDAAFRQFVTTRILLLGVAPAPIWGRMADISSRRVMALASTLAGLLGIAMWLLANSDSQLLANPWLMMICYLTLIISHSGSGSGVRSTLWIWPARPTAPPWWR